jgi:glycine cleavage system H protein
MNIPEDLYYTADHEWLKVDGDEAFVGITDFAQSELGDIVFVEVETVGQNVKEAEVFGIVEAVKTVSDLFLPLDAEVLEKNEKLNDQPDLINTDPYGEGWIIKIKLADSSATEKLLTAEAYRKSIGR